MRDYNRAVEILEELKTMLDDDKIYMQSENDRFYHKNFINMIAKDFPHIPYDELKEKIADTLRQQCEKQSIIFENKKYIIEVPNLKVILYTFLCMNTIDKYDFIDKSNMLNLCIGIAKTCSDEVEYTNDKLRSLISELANI